MSNKCGMEVTTAYGLPAHVRDLSSLLTGPGARRRRGPPGGTSLFAKGSLPKHRAKFRMGLRVYSRRLRAASGMLAVMAIPFRPYQHWYTSLPVRPGTDVAIFSEPMSDKLAWLRLRQLTDVPSKGLALFAGTRTEKNRLYIEFKNFIRQAQTYWEAAHGTEGSASTLLYYYSALNLAKAELLRTNPAEIVGKSIHHGLSARLTQSNSFKSDRVATPRGVFPLLFEKRTGTPLPPQLRFPVNNVLSLLPEIGHEMTNFGRSRPAAWGGMHSVATDTHAAWSVIAMHIDMEASRREPVVRLLLAQYEQISGDSNWRRLFGISTRSTGGMAILQSKKTFSTSSPPVPDHQAAMSLLGDTIGPHLSSPHDMRVEYVVTPSVRKSENFFLPLSLARYMSMFYMSSLVRYRPSAIDPVREGEQAWLADSFARETPTHLLADAVEFITGEPAYFEPDQFRL